MSEGAKPRVSICSQIYNQKDWAMEMIGSVIGQTFPDWELIIVDDGSTDDLKSAVEHWQDPRIKYVRFDENRGVPAGTNHALRMAQGDYVGMLAADEVIDKNKLAQQVQYLDSNEVIDCVWGLPGQGDFGKRPEWEQYELRAHNRTNEAWLRTLLNLEGVPIGGASLLMRRRVMEELGYINEALTVFSDHELYCRFFERGHIGVVLPFRWARDKGVAHAQSVRAKNADKAENELRIVRELHPLKTPSVGGLVTIGIPCYNYGRYLQACVDSILKQDYGDLEIIILDDGSTDETKEVIGRIEDPRVRAYGFKENLGIQAAMNALALHAKGEFIAYVAADDTIEPTAISELMAKFAENPWLEFCSCQNDFIDEAGNRIDENTDNEFAKKLMQIRKPVNKPREQWLSELFFGNQYFGIGMYRTAAVRSLGWNKEYGVIADYEMYVNLLQRENIGIVEKPLTHTRVHPGQYSALDPERSKELPELYQKIRRRYWRPLLKVYIATPFYELKGFSPYIVSLIETTKLLTAMGIQWQFCELSGDSYVHRARNTIADAFLRDPDATDLFFIDSDMGWDPHGFIKMLLLPEPVVGGAYPVKNNWELWTSVPLPVPEEGGRIGLRGRELGDGTALIEARVLAGGFLRIKRQALERFRECYPDFWYTEPSTRPQEPEARYTEFFNAAKIDNQFHGEDHWFSRRMRDMGMPMFIFPDVTITHWGYKDFTGNYHKFLKERPDLKRVENQKAS